MLHANDATSTNAFHRHVAPHLPRLRQLYATGGCALQVGSMHPMHVYTCASLMCMACVCALQVGVALRAPRRQVLSSYTYFRLRISRAHKTPSTLGSRSPVRHNATLQARDLRGWLRAGSDPQVAWLTNTGCSATHGCMLPPSGGAGSDSGGTRRRP